MPERVPVITPGAFAPAIPLPVTFVPFCTKENVFGYEFPPVIELPDHAPVTLICAMERRGAKIKAAKRINRRKRWNVI